MGGIGVESRVALEGTLGAVAPLLVKTVNQSCLGGLELDDFACFRKLSEQPL